MSEQSGFMTLFGAQLAASEAIRQVFAASLLAPFAVPPAGPERPGKSAPHQTGHAHHRADPHNQLIIPAAIAADGERGLFA